MASVHLLPDNKENASQGTVLPKPNINVPKSVLNPRKALGNIGNSHKADSKQSQKSSIPGAKSTSKTTKLAITSENPPKATCSSQSLYKKEVQTNNQPNTDFIPPLLSFEGFGNLETTIKADRPLPKNVTTAAESRPHPAKSTIKSQNLTPKPMLAEPTAQTMSGAFDEHDEDWPDIEFIPPHIDSEDDYEDIWPKSERLTVEEIKRFRDLKPSFFGHSFHSPPDVPFRPSPISLEISFLPLLPIEDFFPPTPKTPDMYENIELLPVPPCKM